MTGARSPASLVGVILVLGSWSMALSALLFSYGLIRAGAPAWPPAALAELPHELAAAGALAAVASSAMLAWGQRMSRTMPIALAVALACALVGIEARLVATVTGTDVRDPSAGVIYALLGFHVVCAAIGALGLVVAALLTRGRRRRLAGGDDALALWGLYWHALAVGWLVIAAAVFVL